MALCAIVPPNQYNNAGWVTTQVNYVWPICMGLIACFPLKEEGRLSPVRCLGGSLALLFACNLEQLCPVLLVFFALFTVRAFRARSQRRWFYLLQTALALLSLCFALTCPGNAARMEASMSDKVIILGGYSDLSLLRKLELGFSATLYHYIMSPNVIYTLLTCLLILLAVGLAFHGHTDVTLLALLLLLAGFCSRMILAFSPTIWISDNRTFLIMDFCCLAVFLLVYKRVCDAERPGWKRGVDTVFACIFVCSGLMNVLQFMQF